MFVPFKFKTTKNTSVARGSKKQFKELSQIGFEEVVGYFHATMRDKRFTEEHGRIANYQPRSPGYMRRKMRQKRHQRPLEFSGKSRRDAKIANIRASGFQVEVMYAGLRGLNRRRSAAAPNMVNEFQRFTDREVKTIERRYDTILNRLLQQHGFTINKAGAYKRG